MDRRERLRQEIEQTKNEFHLLLEEVPDELLDLASENPEWTIREVLFHMSLAPRMLSTDLRMIINNRWYYRVIPAVVPKSLFNGANKWFTRYRGRNATREDLLAAYDEAHQQTLRALDSVEESELDCALNYPDWDPMLSDQVTAARLFHYVKDHFKSHEEQIRKILEQHTSR